MSGTPAIDTRSQHSFIKQKQCKKTKGKANKKAKNVAVRIGRFFHFFFALFSHFFRFIFVFFRFFPRRVQQKHICRFFSLFFRFIFVFFFSLYFRFFVFFALFLLFALFLHFHLLLFCFFFTFFHKKNYLMVGHVWLPSPNISYAEVVVVVATPPVPVPRGP